MNIREGLTRDVARRYRLLTPAERRLAAFLLALSLCATVLEWLGGASVLAFVGLLASAQPIPVPRWLEPVATLLGASPEARRITASVGMGVFHLFRIVALLMLLRVRARVRGEIGHNLSGRLLDAHLAAPLSRHTRRNSAQLIREVGEHAPMAWSAVDAAMSMATEIFVVTGLLVMLAVVRPLPVLGAGVALILFVYGSLRLTRRAAAAHANRTRAVEATSLRALQQLYGAWREVTVLGRESYFRDQFIGARREALSLAIRTDTLTQIPRSLLEAAFVLGACVLALFSGGGSGAFSVLGLYAYTGFRAIPAAERILAYLAQVRWYVIMSEDLVDELAEAQRQVTVAQPLAFTREVRVEGVGFTHPDATAPALADVSLTIPRGSSLAIVGRTGAGKSTLLDMLLGLLPPAEGRIAIDETTVDLRTLRSWRAHIGYVPQSAFVLDDTVRRNVAFGIPDAAIDDARVHRALDSARAGRFVAAMPHGIDTVVGENGTRLSGGERQRLSIARALYHDPEVLVFDEATSALDPATERELTEATRSLAGRTMIVVTHRLSTARRCERIAVLSHGRLAGIGTWDELAAQCPAFRELVADGDVVDGDVPDAAPDAAPDAVPAVRAST